MGAKQTVNSLIKQFAFILLLVAPLAAAVTWTIEPSFRTLLATLTYDSEPLSEDVYDNYEQNLNLKRQIQKHFLNFKIYIPLEDIVTIGPNSKEKMMQDIMARSCGKANIYVWTPLGFRLPFLGQKFIDRCWKPSIQIGSQEEPTDRGKIDF